MTWNRGHISMVVSFGCVWRTTPACSLHRGLIRDRDRSKAVNAATEKDAPYSGSFNAYVSSSSSSVSWACFLVVIRTRHAASYRYVPYVSLPSSSSSSSPAAILLASGRLRITWRRRLAVNRMAEAAGCELWPWLSPAHCAQVSHNT